MTPFSDARPAAGPEFLRFRCSARGCAALFLLALLALPWTGAPRHSGHLAVAAAPSWMTRVQREIAAREYEASWSGAELQAPNRAHRLRTYFEATGIFPIMHVVAVRRSLIERYPSLAPALYRAFCAAKDLAIRDLEIEQAPKTMLPWAPGHLAETRRLLGRDFWPYGVEDNRVTLEAQVRWAFEQGLIPRPVALDEFFAVS